MAYYFNENYFFDTIPKIHNNNKLRAPQIEAYYKTLNYFNGTYDNRNALIVLPTGVGKTGVMGLIPFSLCKKRTLIITPGTTIRDSVLENLNPQEPNNFWYKYGVIETGFPLPSIIEYDGNDTPLEVLNASNIVILNIQKVQERLNSSITKRTPKDFFDVIIIDEAHHSTANTWTQCISYFNSAKIIKLTGTPFRTDGEEIVGHLVYQYSLSRAMSNKFVKSLSNIVYTPDELKLTIDNDPNKEYTVEEILNLRLKDTEWITRSVAFSSECSLSIVDTSIKALEEKKLGSSIPHKIIAIACSIEHAKQIEELYFKRGLRTTIIHSNLSEQDKNTAFNDIENNRVDVVINVAMLGEGYDHPYLSVAAIFRPFRNELPYTQFIGRILRYIKEGTAKDNVGIIISHKHLYLEKLWNKYKKEIEESKIIDSLKNYEPDLDNIFDPSSKITGTSSQNNRTEETLGQVHQSSSHTLSKEDYLDTDLIKKSEEEAVKIQKQIKQIQEILNVSREQAMAMIKQTQTTPNEYARPDLLYKKKKKDLNLLIQEEIIPMLINKHNIDKDGIDIKDCGLFTGSYWYIPNTVLNKKYDGKNAAMLAMYYNKYLKDKIGKERKQWSDDDFSNAFNYTDKLTELIDKKLKIYYNK